MTPITSNAKTRTAALPVIHTSFLSARQESAAKNNVASLVDGILNGVVFGPYLVPVTRRVE